MASKDRTLETTLVFERYLTRRRVLSLAAGAGLGSLLLAACGGDDDDDEPTDVPDSSDTSETEESSTATEAATQSEAADAPTGQTEESDEATPGGDDDVKRGGTLRIAVSDDWRVLDPPLYANITDRHVFYAIFDPLVAMDEKLDIVPSLAASWEVSDDAIEWTFMLQEGVTFHDGTPFNAEAAKFNLDRILNPETGSRLYQELVAIQEVSATDELTLVLSLDQPFTPMISWLTDVPGLMSSPTAVTESGEEYSSHPVGTGPFVFEESSADQLRLSRFEEFWRPGLPYLDEVVYQPIPDPSVKLSGLRSGAVDLVNEIPPRDVELIADDPDFRTIVMEGSRWRVIHLNQQVPPLDNVAVRQALNLAVDRQAIIDAVYFGQGTPAFGPISPVFGSVFDPNIEEYALSYDPELARQKLVEGGFPDGFSLTMDLASSPDIIRIAELVQANWAEIGVDVEIKPSDGNAAFDKLSQRNFEAGLSSWTPRPDPDGTLRRHFHSESELNYQSYANPRVDELLDLTRELPPGEERVEAYREMQRILVEEAPWVYLVFENITRVMTQAVEGLPAIPDTLMRPATVWLND